MRLRENDKEEGTCEEDNEKEAILLRLDASQASYATQGVYQMILGGIGLRLHPSFIRIDVGRDG